MAVLIPAQGGSAISNGQIINGVANFWQPTAPTTRVGGAPLVAGDFWHKPTDNGIPGTAGDWIWTGSYWVGAHSISLPLGLAGNQSGTSYSAQLKGTLPFNEIGGFTGRLYVDHCRFIYRQTGTVDASNYWYFALFACGLSSGVGNDGAAQYIVNGLSGATDSAIRTTVADANTVINKAINSPLALSGPPTLYTYSLQLYAYKVGTPGNLSIATCELFTRKQHP